MVRLATLLKCHPRNPLIKPRDFAHDFDDVTLRLATTVHSLEATRLDLNRQGQRINCGEADACMSLNEGDLVAIVDGCLKGI